MIKLPNEVLTKIFEYDITYHNIFKKVKEEFHKKTSFWRINKYSILNNIDNISPFISNYYDIKNIINDYDLNNKYRHNYSCYYEGYNLYYYSLEFIGDNNNINLVSLIIKLNTY